MKKVIISLYAILIVVFVLFSVLDLKGDYRAESQLWRLNKKLEKVSKDPQSIPGMVFDKLAVEYKDFAAEFSHSKLAPLADILAARVYLLKKDNNAARDILEEVIVTYNDNPEIGSEAIAEIARTYAAENDIPNVIKTYERMINEYPLTDLGLKAPYLKGRYFSDLKENVKEKESYRQAVVYYEKVIQDQGHSPASLKAMRLLANCHFALGNWEDGTRALGDVLIQYPEPVQLRVQSADQIVKSINTIAVGKLNDYDLPVNIYQKFIRKHPEHHYTPYFKDMIKSLQLLEESKVGIAVDKPES